VGTSALIGESWAVAGYFAVVGLDNGVGSMVPNHIEALMVKTFHPSAFQEPSSLLDHLVKRQGSSQPNNLQYHMNKL